MSNAAIQPAPAVALPAGVSATAAKPIVLTGAQPSGKLHLGNYLGAVVNWDKMQGANECFYFIADQHAITVPKVPAELRKNIYSCLAQYLACGLDPQRSHIFAQSHVVGHTELAWVLGCSCPLGWLERMTQFKDKSRKQESVGAGLLYYPILMAADILLYNAHFVPVGEDQKQHLEITRDIAEKFNRDYSPTFNVPEPFIGETGARIMSLQNPETKMSKSDPNQNGVVFLIDPPDVVRKKIQSAVTDSGGEVRAAADKPGITNLLSIFSAVTGQSVADLENEFAGKGYGDFKRAVADAVIARLEPVRLRYEEFSKDTAYLDSVLKSGAEAAQRVAYKTLSKVYRKVGFVERPR
ncbi:MAG: tryptophan--tRNA ligase [Puniceicoccales bacterium]|jgi:tryptophanyl-tRNA synthetase|nr:tryptophan--tRNA ligase [Puniceicoccales bacterium]